MELSGTDKSAPFDCLGSSWDQKTLRISVDRGRRVLRENARFVPRFQVLSGLRIAVICLCFGLFEASKDDSDQVIRAGFVVPVLHFRIYFVVRLGDNVA